MYWTAILNLAFVIFKTSDHLIQNESTGNADNFLDIFLPYCHFALSDHLSYKCDYHILFDGL